MRLLLPLLLLAGCGSSSSSSDMQMTSSGPDMATSSCSQTVAAYCAAVGNCKQDLATAMTASSWCPSGSTGVMVTLQHCGAQTLVIATYSESADHFVYENGSLAAVFTTVSHTNDLTCVAGPSMYAAPSGCDSATTLCQ